MQNAVLGGEVLFLVGSAARAAAARKRVRRRGKRIANEELFHVVRSCTTRVRTTVYLDLYDTLSEPVGVGEKNVEEESQAKIDYARYNLIL